MAQCARCGRSGVLLRTTAQGFCKSCQEEIRKKAEGERERIKEALICARFLKDTRDKELHLRRAMDGVRVLSRYERMGYDLMKPSPGALAELIEEKLRELHSERKEAGTEEEHADPQPAEATPGMVASAAEASQAAPALAADADRRAALRTPATFWVRLESGLRGLTVDVSPLGMRVRAAQPHEPGTRLRFTLDAPKGAVAAEGVVRWVRQAAGSGERRLRAVMGLEFSNPPPELRAYGQ